MYFKGWPRSSAALPCLGDGINGEIQIHTADSWELKKRTDELYRRWRAITRARFWALSEADQHAMEQDVATCWQLWADYWGRVPAEVKAAISAGVKGRESIKAPTVTSSPGFQTPSSSTVSSSDLASSRTSRPSGSWDSSGRSISSSIAGPGGPVKSAPENIRPASGPDLTAALEHLSLESLREKARQIGVSIKGRKAQLAEMIASNSGVIPGTP